MSNPHFFRSQKKRRFAAALILFLVLVCAVLTGAANYLVNYALVPAEGRGDEVAPASAASMTEEDRAVISANRSLFARQVSSWVESCPPEILSLCSEDGLALEADLFSRDDSHRWVLLAHGYGSRREKMRNIGSVYTQKGYQVLIPDMRAHGHSEGDYIGMGWLDRRDLLLWIDKILEMDPQAEIVLHGVSMGGASVMMVSGEQLPSQVRVIIEDCGYTSAWDIFSDELDYLFHLPPFPIMQVSNLVAQFKAGYSLREASALNQIRKCRVPTLFIHGLNDTFVPAETATELYRAAPCEKELLIVPGAGHGESYLRNPERYFSAVFDFTKAHLE